MALCLFIENELRSLLHSGSLSGSGVGAPPPRGPPGLSAEVKMDEMATVMNARSDRWMNGKHGDLTEICLGTGGISGRGAPTIESGAGLLKSRKVRSASG